VSDRTREKGRLILEINHRVGNQLQILSSLVRIERRTAVSDETSAVLDRISERLDIMGTQHLELSQNDYLSPQREAGDMSGGAESRADRLSA